MSISPAYERPPTAQQAALKEIRRWILSGRLKPGDQVVQDVVATELRVSVVPVREALKTLESEGLLVHAPHRGFFVTELSRDELLELCDVRSTLETMAVQKSVPQLTAADIDSMRGLIAAMEQADRDQDVVRMINLDRAFHFTVFDAAGMDQLKRIIAIAWDQSDPYRAVFFANPTNRVNDHKDHRKILAALRKRDTARVVLLLDEHRLRPLRQLESLTPVDQAAPGAP